MNMDLYWRNEKDEDKSFLLYALEKMNVTLFIYRFRMGKHLSI